jgi:histidine decarboxylase
VTATPDHVTTVLDELRADLDEDAATNIGFPSTFAFDYTPLLPLFNLVLNNVGDPFESSAYPRNTKHLEREVIGWFAELLRAPADDFWGYVTHGGSEGLEYGLHLGRTVLPDAITYYNSAAHYSVPRALARFCMPAVAVRADASGVMEYDDLRAALVANRQRPAIIAATAGTTMTEACDDVTTIRAILSSVPIPRAYIHVDAALSGLILPFLIDRPGFDLADGADSISVSGHKALGSAWPCGVVVTRDSLRRRIGARVDYVGTADTTLSGSRNGHSPLVLWYAIQTLGLAGLRKRAEECLRVAQYGVGALTRVGWRAWRHPAAVTVVLDAPPEAVRTKWRLASSNGLAHVVAVPGVSTDQLDQLAADCAATLPTLGPIVVRQRTAESEGVRS